MYNKNRIQLRRLMGLILSVSLILTGIPLEGINWKDNILSHAEEVTYDPVILNPGYWGANITASVSGDTLTLSGSGAMKDFTSTGKPDKLGTIKNLVISEGITSIGDSAFYHNQLTSVTIPDSVTTIREHAFSYNQLTSVTIPDSVTTIGWFAFAYNQLTSVTIGNSVTTIDYGAFSSNQLTSVTIPDSVTTIGYEAFSNNNLTSVTIGNSVKTIDGYAFKGNQLISVTIPNSVTTIRDRAFYKNQLTSVTIGNSVTTIDGAFYDNQLTSITIPDSVTTIGWGTFGKNQLTSVIIPNSVTTIGGQAFEKNQLTSITIPDSVTTIGLYAFNSNPINTITVGSSKDYINILGNYAGQLNTLYNANGKQAGTYTLNKNIKTYYNDSLISLDVESYYDLDQNKIRVPVNLVNQEFGARVVWNETTKVATIQRVTKTGKKVEIKLTEGSTTANVNGQNYTITMPVKRETGDRLTIWGAEIVKFYDDIYYAVKPDREGGTTSLEAHYSDNPLTGDEILPKIDPPYIENFTNPTGEILFPENDALLTTIVNSAEGTTTGDGSFVKGSQVIVTANPKIGYKFKEWQKEGAAISTETPYRFTITEDTTLTAIMELSNVNLNIIKEGLGNVTQSIPNPIPNKSNITLTATPDIGYTFKEWKKEGLVLSTNPNYTFEIDGDTTITAVFQPITYNVTLTYTPNGVPSGSATISQTSANYGTVINLTANPNPGSTFEKWTQTISGVTTDYSIEANTPYTVTNNTTLTALFKPIDYIIITEKVGNGTITRNLNNPLKYNQTLNLTATPDSNNQFVKWTRTIGGTTTDYSTNSSISYTVNSDATLTAVFQPVTYNITTSVIGNGNISRDKSNPIVYGDTLNLTATPDSNNQFVKWTRTIEGTTTDYSTNSSITYTVNSDATLTAVFQPAPADVWSTVWTNAPHLGEVSRSKPNPTVGGESITITATELTGGKFVEWKKNGIFLSNLKTLTVTPQTGDLFQAEFQNETFNFQILPYDVDTGQIINNIDTTQYNGDYTLSSEIILNATPDKVPYIFSHFEDELGNVHGDRYSTVYYYITQNTTWKAMYKKAPWIDAFVIDKDTSQVLNGIEETPTHLGGALAEGQSFDTRGFYTLPLGYKIARYLVYEAEYTNPTLFNNPYDFNEWLMKSSATFIEQGTETLPTIYLNNPKLYMIYVEIEKDPMVNLRTVTVRTPGNEGLEIHNKDYMITDAVKFGHRPYGENKIFGSLVVTPNNGQPSYGELFEIPANSFIKRVDFRSKATGEVVDFIEFQNSMSVDQTKYLYEDVFADITFEAGTLQKVKIETPGFNIGGLSDREFTILSSMTSMMTITSSWLEYGGYNYYSLPDGYRINTISTYNSSKTVNLDNYNNTTGQIYVSIPNGMDTVVEINLTEIPTKALTKSVSEPDALLYPGVWEGTFSTKEGDYIDLSPQLKTGYKISKWTVTNNESNTIVFEGESIPWELTNMPSYDVTYHAEITTVLVKNLTLTTADTSLFQPWQQSMFTTTTREVGHYIYPHLDVIGDNYISGYKVTNLETMEVKNYENYPYEYFYMPNHDLEMEILVSPIPSDSRLVYFNIQTYPYEFKFNNPMLLKKTDPLIVNAGDIYDPYDPNRKPVFFTIYDIATWESFDLGGVEKTLNTTIPEHFSGKVEVYADLITIIEVIPVNISFRLDNPDAALTYSPGEILTETNVSVNSLLKPYYTLKEDYYRAGWQVYDKSTGNLLAENNDIGNWSPPNPWRRVQNQPNIEYVIKTAQLKENEAKIKVNVHPDSWYGDADYPEVHDITQPITLTGNYFEPGWYVDRWEYKGTVISTENEVTFNIPPTTEKEIVFDLYITDGSTTGNNVTLIHQLNGVEFFRENITANIGDIIEPHPFPLGPNVSRVERVYQVTTPDETFIVEYTTDNDIFDGTNIKLNTGLEVINESNVLMNRNNTVQVGSIYSSLDLFNYLFPDAQNYGDIALGWVEESLGKDLIGGASFSSSGNVADKGNYNFTLTEDLVIALSNDGYLDMIGNLFKRIDIYVRPMDKSTNTTLNSEYKVRHIYFDMYQLNSGDLLNIIVGTDTYKVDPTFTPTEYDYSPYGDGDIQIGPHYIEVPYEMEVPAGPDDIFTWDLDNPTYAVVTGLKPEYKGVVTDITIPAIKEGKPVTEVGNYAFSGDNLIQVVLPSTIVRIGDGSFTHNKISSIILPEGVTYLGVWAFSDNELDNIVIPENLSTINDYVFLRNKLKNVVIPDTITSIGMGSFQLNEITNVTFGNAVTIIGEYCFYSNQLTTITLPNSLTTLGSSSFMKNNISSVVIPNATLSIGIETFEENPLTKITIPNQNTTVESNNFNANPYVITRDNSDSQIKLNPTKSTQTSKVQILGSVVTFDLDGGIGSFPALTVQSNQPIFKPTENPTKEGHTFIMWSVDGTNEYNFNSVPSNITVKAIWNKDAVVNPPIDPPPSGEVEPAPDVPEPPPFDPESNEPVVTIELPEEGTHYQVSNDNITWSDWYRKPGNTRNVQVETQPGEGLKKIFYRTGDFVLKKTPMFNGTSIEYVDSDERIYTVVSPLGIVEKTIDMTPPVIKIKTSDNTFITKDGQIDLNIDVTDNLDKQPQVRIEVIETDSKGRRKSEPKSAINGRMSKEKTQLNTNIPNLAPKQNNGKILPYFVRIEAFDSKGNSTVETITVYSKQ